MDFFNKVGIQALKKEKKCSRSAFLFFSFAFHNHPKQIYANFKVPLIERIWKRERETKKQWNLNIIHSTNFAILKLGVIAHFCRVIQGSCDFCGLEFFCIRDWILDGEFEKIFINEDIWRLRVVADLEYFFGTKLETRISRMHRMIRQENIFDILYEKKLQTHLWSSRIFAIKILFCSKCRFYQGWLAFLWSPQRSKIKPQAWMSVEFDFAPQVFSRVPTKLLGNSFKKESFLRVQHQVRLLKKYNWVSWDCIFCAYKPRILA